MAEERDTAELFEDLAAIHQELKAEAQEQAQQEAGDELSQFFTQSLDLLCIAGFDGYFKRLNPAWEIRLGWSLEELKARPFLDFVHPEDRKTTMAQIVRRNKGEEVNLFENRYRCRDGSYRWLRWQARPEPRSQRIHAIARDVTRQKRLEREILEILDHERERLGRELHDGLCQTLAGIAALSTTLSRRLAKSSEDAASSAAAEITQLLNEAINEARDLARGLGPLGLEGADLEGALEGLALMVEKQFRVSCSLECDRFLPGLGHEAALHLFRIAQESVSNAVIHGKGDRIEISVNSEDGTGILTIRCNGVGKPYDSPNLDGIGMHTMVYRARLIGGSLEVRPRRPSGTAVTCTFPLSEVLQSERPDTGETSRA